MDQLKEPIETIIIINFNPSNNHHIIIELKIIIIIIKDGINKEAIYKSKSSEMAASLKSFSPSTHLIPPKKHLGLSNSPPYHLSAPSKPFLNPNLAAKIRPFSPINAITEEREIAEQGGDNQDGETSSISSKMEEIKEFTSSDRLLNAAIVLGAGSLAITKLLTIDHDYWQVSLLIAPFARIFGEFQL